MTGEVLAAVIGAGMAVVLAVTPWLVMVHAKLAVLSTQMATLQDAVAKLVNSEQHRQCSLHAQRLEEQQKQLDYMLHRLEAIGE